MDIERRYIPLDAMPEDGLTVEERDGESPKIRGIAPPWDSLSVDLGGFREKFSPTAFDKLLSKKRLDVPLLFNHDDSKILARTTNGTLRIEKSDKGLAYEADPVATPTAAEVLTLIRSKTIFGSSFAFTVGPKGEEWAEDERGNVTRTIHEASGLFDLSPVTRAAYPSSSLSARSLSAWKAARGIVAHRDDSRGLTISLDYDRTFTAAPGLWRSFVADATARGNRVVCITRRDDTEENRQELRLAFGDLELAGLILCGPDTRKRSAAEAAGVEVDVWIDDYPEGIVPATPPAAPAGDGSRSVRISTIAAARAAAAASVARMRIHAG
jgi:HK97 family phage prohead protease